LLETALAVFKLSELLGHSLLLALDFLKFGVSLAYGFLSLVEAFLGLLLQLLLKLLVLLENAFLDLRLCQLGLILGLAVKQ